MAKSKKREEDKLRAEIYQHYHDNNIDDANRLVGTFQEFTPVQVMLKKPLGLTPGLSDLIFFGDYATGFLEVKYPGSSWPIPHVKRQAELLMWYQNNVKSGASGYFITSVAASIYAINICSGSVIWENPEGFETAAKVYNRILELEKQNKKTIKF